MIQEFARRVGAFLPRLGAGLGVFLAFFAIAVAAGRVLRAPHVSSRVPRELWLILARTVKSSLVVLGLVMSLGTMGVDVSAVVAGLGLTGFALGFAVKDALSNVLAGIMTVIYKPFRVGDRIQVVGLEGVVMDIDMRYTLVDAGDRRHLIPNSTLLNHPVAVLARGRDAGPASR